MPKALTEKRADELYRGGILTAQEATHQAVLCAAECGAENIVPELSSELTSLVQKEMTNAPKSEQEWQSFRSIQCGTWMSEFDFERAEQEWIARYRAGIEALRAYFDTPKGQ